MAGFSLPVAPRRRCIFVFRSTPLPNFPMLIDPTGAYVRPEGPAGQYLCGLSPTEDNDPDVSYDDFAVDDALFSDHMWPILADRVPAFESLKITSSWAGHYAFNKFDHNVVVGPHPKLHNFFMANGCSGHGLMHSPAVGRAVAEHIHTGAFQTIDLKRFGFDRIARGEKIVERNVI